MNNMTRKIMQSLLLKITHFDQASLVRLVTRLQLGVVRRLSLRDLLCARYVTTSICLFCC